MAKRQIRVYAAERSNEFVRKVTIWSDRTLGNATTGHYTVKVGSSNTAGDIEFFGAWDMSVSTLEAGKALVLTGAGDLNWPLFEDDACIIEVEQFGEPGSISGLVVEWKFRRAGAVGEIPIERTEQDQPPAREVSTPLFASSTWVTDPDTQGALDELYTGLNSSGVTEWVQSVVVPDMFGNLVGDFRLDDPQWDDLRVSLATGKPGATKAPGFSQFQDDGAGSTGVHAYHFDKNSTEELFFEIQMPHAWAMGTEIEPHIHWAPSTSGAGAVYWEFEWTVASIGGVYGNTTIAYAVGSTNSIADEHLITEFSSIDMTSYGLSNVMLCRIARVGGNAADTYGADAVGLSVDFHYKIDGLGSTQEYVK